MRLQHNADGTYEIRADWEEAEELLKDNGIRPHALKGNFIWDLPGVEAAAAAMKVVGAIVNDWQISGIYTGTSGTPYDIGVQLQRRGLEPEPDGFAGLRGAHPHRRRPGRGCSDDQYAQFNTAAFAGPTYNSLGLESGRNYMKGCFENNFDFADRAKHPARRLALAAVPRGHLQRVQHGGLSRAGQTQLQLNSPTDQTVRNPQIQRGWQRHPARTRPQDAGFGAVTGAADLRSIQLQIRLGF